MALKKRQTGDLSYFISENITAPHAFTTRLGGVSTGVYASLNLGMHLGDDPEAVRENWRRILAEIGGDSTRLAFHRQVHGNHVRRIGEADVVEDIFTPHLVEGDGLIANVSGVTLVAFSADCIPILLEDKKTGVVGAIHAGWRSTVLDIAGKAIEKCVAEFATDPGDISVAIGAGIGPCCFETEAEVPQAVQALDLAGEDTLIKTMGAGKFMVDLKEVNRRLFLRAGVLPEHISLSPHCTACAPDLFWSHRKMGQNRGSLAALICKR